MFDLDAAIREWRDSFGESLRVDDLDELEEHLRAQVAELGTVELSAEEAFLVARHRIGRTGELAKEFAKVHAGSVWIGRAQWMVLGILASNALLLGSRVVAGMAAWGASASGLGTAGSAGVVAVAFALALVLFGWGLFRTVRLPLREGRGVVFLCLVFALLGPLFFIGRGGLVIAQARTLRPVEIGQMAVNQSYVLTAASILLPLVLFSLVLLLERSRRTA